MKTSKLIALQIILMIITLGTFMMYFAWGIPGISREWLKIMAMPTLTFLALFLISIFVTLSYIVPRVLYKKNFLRVSLIFTVILFLSSLGRRIYEIMSPNWNFCAWCLIVTILYLVIFFIQISMLKDIYKLVEKIFSKE